MCLYRHIYHIPHQIWREKGWKIKRETIVEKDQNMFTSEKCEISYLDITSLVSWKRWFWMFETIVSSRAWISATLLIYISFHCFQKLIWGCNLCLQFCIYQKKELSVYVWSIVGNVRIFIMTRWKKANEHAQVFCQIYCLSPVVFCLQCITGV